VDAHHQKSPWGVDTGAVPSDTDDTAPAVPVIGTLLSYEKDKPGTRRVDCDLTIPLTFAGCDEVEVSVADASGGHTRIHSVGGLASYTFYFQHHFDRGDTLGVAVRGKKGTAYSAWSSVSNIVAGSSTGAAPAGPSAPTLTTLQRGTNKTRLRVTLATGDSPATKKASTHIEIFTARRWSPTIPTPDSWEGAEGGSTAVASGYRHSLEQPRTRVPGTAGVLAGMRGRAGEDAGAPRNTRPRLSKDMTIAT